MEPTNVADVRVGFVEMLVVLDKVVVLELVFTVVDSVVAVLIKLLVLMSVVSVRLENESEMSKLREKQINNHFLVVIALGMVDVVVLVVFVGNCVVFNFMVVSSEVCGCIVLMLGK